jgi:N-acetylmuramoyl-L-alanine amidase
MSDNTSEQSSALALHRTLETDTLARTLWGEARGEGSIGMTAVACVVMNRLAIARPKASYWWGNSIIQICQKPFQFSCWNKDDPNFRKLLAVDATDLQFATALRLARRAICGILPDSTHSATYYHAAGETPYWAVNQKPVAVIGRQIFYRIV